jgi:outer membrane immunogenic protein
MMRTEIMKNHLIAALGLAALLVGPAYAADMPLLRKAPAVMEDPWSGFYLGVIGGFGTASSTHEAGGLGTLGTFDQKGWVAGGMAGYNWRPGPVVVGVELDISEADIQGSTGVGLCGAFPGVTAVPACQTKVSWFYTGRARLGYPIGPFMPYVTGGGIVAGLKALEDGVQSGASPHLAGWVAGGGLEFMPVPQWTIRAEYLHAALVNKMEATDLLGYLPGETGTVTITQHDINMVRVGLTYYLGKDKYITER